MNELESILVQIIQTFLLYGSRYIRIFQIIVLIDGIGKESTLNSA